MNTFQITDQERQVLKAIGTFELLLSEIKRRVRFDPLDTIRILTEYGLVEEMDNYYILTNDGFTIAASEAEWWKRDQDGLTVSDPPKTKEGGNLDLTVVCPMTHNLTSVSYCQKCNEFIMINTRQGELCCGAA